VVLKTVASWAFVVYIFYMYLVDPYGHWDALKDICCQPQEKIPLYLHMVTAVIILLLSPFQISNNLCKLRIHRYTGVLYVLACMLTSLYGLTFIVLNGTVGRLGMTIPFTIAGVLTFTFSLITPYYAIMGPYYLHRAWAFRLDAVATASTFYRILYFLVYPLINLIVPGLHSKDFDSPLDDAFSSLYFLIPMVIVELYLWIQFKRVHLFNVSCGKPVVNEETKLISDITVN